jgi:hypothetical protein
MPITQSPAQSSSPSLSWYDLPDSVKQLLIAAANSWDDPAQAQSYMQQALTLSNQALDVLVAAYRYFFYQHNDAAALQIANQVLAQVRQLEGLPDDWAELGPILAARKEEAPIRLYLNAYTASGLILARLNAIDQAIVIATRVNELDDRREFGAATVLHILTQSEAEEE